MINISLLIKLFGIIHNIFFLDFIGLVGAYWLVGDLTIPNTVWLFLMSYAVDIDPLLTLFIRRNRYRSFYEEVVSYLREYNIIKACEVAVRRHKELNSLVLHNYVAFPMFWIALYYSLYIQADSLLIYMLCGMLTHFVFDICDDVYQLGHINNWLWPFLIFTDQTVVTHETSSGTENRKALVISGGGAKGAWGGGVVEFLQDEKHQDYDLYIGISTGGLISVLAAVNKLDVLKNSYSNLDFSNIFKDNPFTKKGRIKIKNVLLALLTSKTSLGDASPLRNVIRNLFTQEDFTRLRESGKEVILCVTCLTDKAVEIKSSNNYTYDEFCEWLYASCCQPIFMNFVTIEGKLYSDGGIKEYAPIQHAIEAGASEVDAIFLRPGESEKKEKWIPKTILDVTLRVEQMLCASVSDNDFEKGILLAERENITLNVYHIPFEILNSLNFDKELMLKWWEEGYADAKQGKCCIHIDPKRVKHEKINYKHNVLYAIS